MTVIMQCICQQLRTILYRYIKQWQLCEIQFAWSLNPIWHNRQGMHVLKPTQIKELSRIFWRENCSGPRLQPLSLDKGLPCGCMLSGVELLKFFGGGNEFMDSIGLFLRHLTTKKNLETARCNIIIIASLWNSTDISAALPQMGLPNFIVIGNV